MRAFENQRALVTGSGATLGKRLPRIPPKREHASNSWRTQEELDRTRMELLQFTPAVCARSLDLRGCGWWPEQRDLTKQE
ncbi:MAG: hypothetical protein JO185_24810 [Acidobacteriaceae bacterium]|nr:hypothetical protein [Acidobacteriaceae bacterium]